MKQLLFFRPYDENTFRYICTVDEGVQINSEEGEFVVGVRTDSNHLHHTVVYVPEVDKKIACGIFPNFHEKVEEERVEVNEFIADHDGFLTEITKQYDQKLRLVKFIKAITGLGLRDSKELLEELKDSCNPTDSFYKSYKRRADG